jgi:TonB-dependent starch-binding outer membrane protein SusC
MESPRAIRSLTTLLGMVAIASGGACSRANPPADRPEGEEVPVGYDTQTRDAITGAVTSVDVEELKGSRYTSIEDMLAGRVAGVSVVRSAGGFSVRIRGVNSLRAGVEPLYVVDGVPMLPRPGRTGVAVNPHDIARIAVLKDAGAAALYGSFGANGVVVITTKRAQ